MSDDISDKIACFQAITGFEDPDLCTEILQAHDWDLQLAISSFTSSDSTQIESHSAAPSATHYRNDVVQVNDVAVNETPGLAWKLINLPISVISTSLGLISGAVGFGIWAAGGILSYSLNAAGIGSNNGSNVGGETTNRLRALRPATSEAMDFVEVFEREYGNVRPAFCGEGFMDALERSRAEYKLLFVYLHSPDNPDAEYFCERTLCNVVLCDFVNENFVCWGGSIRASEGFNMSNSFKALRFPFCAVVMADANQRMALLQQVEGPRTAEEMLVMLQQVLEESSPILAPARLEAEERRINMRLREEQDAAYRVALEADQARERQRREEQERAERETVEAERRLKEEEDTRERAVFEAAEKEVKRKKLLVEKAKSLGAEPEKGPHVTQVQVRFPMGERKERRFHSDTTIQTLYNFVDTLDCLNSESYSLVSNFPRVVFGQDKLSHSLKEAGLHPQASLFVELNS